MSALRVGLLTACLAAASHASVVFNTFVSSGAIAAVEGQSNTIGFSYAGDKFVGTVYFGSNNLQLYSTNLSGGNVQLFGSPMPASGPSGDGHGGEVIVAGSLGHGFGSGAVYGGSGTDIYHWGDTGGVPTLFATGLVGNVRGMLFDPGTTFGGDLLVSTTAGNIYKIDSSGNVHLVASTGEDTEGMDIIPLSAPGPLGATYGGYMAAVSEGSGALRLISPGGTVIDTGVRLGALETINYIPTSSSGNPVEGYYEANYPFDIQKAPTSSFAGLGGGLLGSSEFGSNAPIWDITYNGTAWSTSSVGTLPNQAEDGIFVTTQRVQAAAPEPASLLLIGGGLAGLAVWRRKRQRA